MDYSSSHTTLKINEIKQTKYDTFRSDPNMYK